MPDALQTLVTNTTPLIALTAATGSLEILGHLYARVVVPFEVAQEIRDGGRENLGVSAFDRASWLEISTAPITLSPYLQNALDRGEASVIQTALQLGLNRVCIDETMGRRVARLCNLNVTAVTVCLSDTCMAVIPDSIRDPCLPPAWIAGRGPQ